MTNGDDPNVSRDPTPSRLIRAQAEGQARAQAAASRETISARQVAVISAVVAMVGTIALAVWVARGDIAESHEATLAELNLAEIERLETGHAAEISRLESELEAVRSGCDNRVNEWKGLYQDSRDDLQRAVDAFRERLPDP